MTRRVGTTQASLFAGVSRFDSASVHQLPGCRRLDFEKGIAPKSSGLASVARDEPRATSRKGKPSGSVYSPILIAVARTGRSRELASNATDGSAGPGCRDGYSPHKRDKVLERKLFNFSFSGRTPSFSPKLGARLVCSGAAGGLQSSPWGSITHTPANAGYAGEIAQEETPMPAYSRSPGTTLQRNAEDCAALLSERVAADSTEAESLARLGLSLVTPTAGSLRLARQIAHELLTMDGTENAGHVVALRIVRAAAGQLERQNRANYLQTKEKLAIFPARNSRANANDRTNHTTMDEQLCPEGRSR